MPTGLIVNSTDASRVPAARLISSTARWEKVIAENTDVAVSDAQDPTTYMLSQVRPIHRGPYGGTYLSLRLVYSTLITAFTALPIVRVLGCTVNDPTSFITSIQTNAPDDANWEILPDPDGNNSIALTANLSTDITQGTLRYGASSALIDCRGCDFLMVGVVTATAVSTVSSGTLADIQDAVYVEGKLI